MGCAPVKSFPAKKKPCDGSCTGCALAFGPNVSVGVKKVGRVGHLPDELAFMAREILFDI